MYPAIAGCGNIRPTGGPMSGCRPSHPQHQTRSTIGGVGDVTNLSPFWERAVRFLHLLYKSVALETYSQLTLGALEWRSENTLTDLKVHQMDVTPVAPQTWIDWVKALTAMSAPPNLLADLCRAISTLRQR